MQKIVPHLWFERDADRAAEFYMSLFKEAKLLDKTVFNDTPSGTAYTITLELGGQEVVLLYGGPYVRFNPSISFLINCDTTEETRSIWEKLIEEGEELMPFGDYPFSSMYGWVIDKFGLSWQVMYNNHLQNRPKIIPTLMYVGEQCGKAEEAMLFYLSVFENSSPGGILRYGEAAAPNLPGTVQHEEFTLENTLFAAMDSALGHDFGFNDAISFLVHCDSQEEIDYYWNKLSAVPKAEQCGWVKDQYGMSWQIVPTALYDMMMDSDQERAERVTKAMLQMKKLDLDKLKKAYDGE
jgi:predicted 3-demethylubiquinone-9 3-methyltransferase (glyoxalase superfamily)